MAIEVCDEKTIVVLKSVLDPKSQFLRAMFDLYIRTPIGGVANTPRDSFKSLVKYLYSRNIGGQFNDRDVLNSADQLDIANINEIYETFASRNITLDNVNGITFIAVEFNLPALKEECIQLFRRDDNWIFAFMIANGRVWNKM